MADNRRHRGPHPADAELFAPSTWPTLRAAVHDLSWLLTRGYARVSALEIVGNRYDLTARQRTAVSRSSADNTAVIEREKRRVPIDDLADRSLRIDGFNLLTTIEAALAGGVLLLGRDGCLRDMASMHGSYRRVEETLPALKLVGQVLAAAPCGPVLWWFDQPVSNSGRLKTIVREVAAERGWDWTVELVPDPDRLLVESTEDSVVVSADAAILDAPNPWLNLARLVVERTVPTARTIDLEVVVAAP